MSRAGSRDEGQVTLLVIGFAAIALLLVTVVINVSRAFLVQRELGAAADGAAASAAGALDVEAVYTGGIGAGLPIDPALAHERVLRYIEVAELPARFDAFSVVAVEVAGDTVTVTLRAVVDLPYDAVVPGRYADGVPVVLPASARSPVAAG